MGSRQRLILALDVESPQKAADLVRRLSDLISFYKIGLRLFTLGGPRIISKLKEMDVKLFLDLKLHDIPNTVADASRAAVSMGVDMFNLHIGGGMRMMQAAVEAARDEADRIGIPPPILLGVTVLTSLDEDEMRRIYGTERSIRDQVAHMAEMAKSAGLNGVVASPLEIDVIRDRCGEDFTIVTPGVRPEWFERGDQRRVMTPSQALRAGADYIVVGRPIYASDDPRGAAFKIIEEIEG
ncbi:orotidine-5'-phosphate decarboxylase [Candidatus Poribacteria bacterium]|nr:orotidine-5'-phosphate decarboxylase [Candidatus Poribacteria bacterium]